MPPLFGIPGRHVPRLRQVLADGGSLGGPSPAAQPVRGVTWVKVTGAPVSGWQPAVVTIDDDGDWSDLDETVLAAAADGSTLALGKRYPCTRTGDADDGTARFRTLRPNFDHSFDDAGADVSLTSSSFVFAGCSRTLLPGWNWMAAHVLTHAKVSALGVRAPSIVARLEWGSNVWPLTSGVGFRVANVQVVNLDVYQECTFGRWIEVDALTTITLTAARDSLGATWVTSDVLAATELEQFWFG